MLSCRRFTDTFFKRTNAADATEKIANQILNDEIVLFPIWPGLKVSRPMTWTENPYQNESWQMYFHSLRFVSHLLNEFEKTGHLAYLEKAQQSIDEWITANHHYGPLQAPG